MHTQTHTHKILKTTTTKVTDFSFFGVFDKREKQKCVSPNPHFSKEECFELPIRELNL